MLAKKFNNPVLQFLYDYGLITLSIEMMVVGIYFFKFPNNFAFGGVSGFSTVLSAMTGFTASDITFTLNMVLLVLGFFVVGRQFGIKTIYASLLLSFSLTAFERLFPMAGPLTEEPLLELIFAILLPAISSAILFQIGASSGGTDIIAMILKRYTSINIGTALLFADATAVALSFLVFGPSTGLFSILGLLAKSILVDDVTEIINRCKCFHIICDDPDPILAYITNELRKGATVYEARGAFTHTQKYIIMTTMKRSQAMKLRSFIHAQIPGAFILINNSSEIVGKGFLKD